MTEDVDQADAEKSVDAEIAPATDAKRFEVKWRKKGSADSTPAGAAVEDATPEETRTPDQLQRDLRDAQEQVTNLRDRWQRAAADLANLKRRTEDEKGEVEKFASMLLVAELLPVLDNFERALETIPGNLAMLTWLQGVVLIERHFKAILERQGLKEIEATGKPFNPALHEAIAEKETSDAQAGSVVQVYQRGYELNGRLIRPALVEIARSPSERTPDAEATSEENAEEIALEAGTENVGP